MKSEKGVTLISLTIYIIVFTIVIAVIGVVTGAFTKNIQKTNFFTDPLTEYTAFNSYFSEDVNHKGIKILECRKDYVVFDNGIQYTYIPENKGVYRDKVKIARNVEFCSFLEDTKNGKTIIIVNFKAGDNVKTTTYTLK